MSTLEPHTEKSNLASQQQDFRSLAENTPDNIARWDTEGRYLYINPVHERLLGKSASEAIGTFIPDSHEAVKTAVIQVAVTGEKRMISQNVPVQDGSIEYHEVSIVPERDASGQIISVLGIGRDVTEQKCAEIALKKSEQILKEAQRIAHFGSWEVDILNDLLTWSDETYRIWEINKERFGATFEAFLETVHPEDRELVAKTYNDSILNRSHYEVEHRLLFPDGRIKYIQERGEPHYDAAGNPIRFIGTSLDITERKRHEAVLREREAFLDSLFKAIPIPVYYKNTDGIYLGVNRVYETFFGTTPEQFIGKSVFDIHPKELAEIYYTKDTEVFEGKGKIQQYETQLKHTNGMLHDIIFSKAAFFDNQGHVKGLIGAILDITERKQHEERLERTKAKLGAVISTIPDLIWVKDAEGIYMMCNPAFENFFGAECGEIIGKTDYDFISREQADFFRQKDKEAMESGEMRINEEEIVFARNGQHALLETRKIPVYNGKEFMGVLGIGRDITERKQMEKELQNHAEFHSTLVNAMYDVDIQLMVIENGKIIYIGNRELARGFGYTDAELDAQPPLLDIIHPDDKARVADTYMRRLAGEEMPNVYEIGLITREGERREFETSSAIVPNTNPVRIVTVGRDITQRKIAEQQLQQALEFNEEIINAIPDLLFELDTEGTYLNVWAQDETLLAAQRSALIGNNIKNILSQDAVEVCLQTMREVDEKGHSLGNTMYVDLPEGRKWFELSASKRKSNGSYIVLSRDITERKTIEKKVEFMAHHDALTGLPNRILAKDRTEQIIAHAKRTGSKAALLFIDLDGFKSINDSMGHSVGDAVLKNIASRLMEGVRASDTISRQGGDEFLLILSDIEEANNIITIAEKLLQEFDKPFNIGGQDLSISASIGIALYPENGESFEALLQSADTAMYQAKESGKNTYCFYTQQMNHNLIGQFKLQNDLRSALQNTEFVLFYQPQIDLAENRITGAEALIRWQHPQMGMIPPMSFIPLAESSGIIVQIGEWVIHEACHQAAQWEKEGKEITVAVNISAVQFKRGNLEAIVKNALESSGLNPKLLELELTESILINDVENILKTVQILKGLGIQLSIDDFGTGYSSLAYLKRFAVDKLKIDQSFVREILTDQEDAAIVKTIIQMAKSLNLTTIAEGVEDAQVLAVVDSYGCDEVQGYHFAKPMEAKMFELYYESF